jgi:hypothetical protein
MEDLGINHDFAWTLCSCLLCGPAAGPAAGGQVLQGCQTRIHPVLLVMQGGERGERLGASQPWEDPLEEPEQADQDGKAHKDGKDGKADMAAKADKDGKPEQTAKADKDGKEAVF